MTREPTTHGGTMARILVVDDDVNIRNIIEFVLEREGYEVITGSDGLEAIERVARDAPQLAILDANMPNLDGFEACRRIRQSSNIPIMMLTARAAEVDKVEGLELGADDYVTKPFSPQELLARIKALLRRANTREVITTEVLTVGGLTIDARHRHVTVDGREVRLTPMEFRVLSCLASSPGEVFSNKHIVKLLYDYDCSEQEALDLVRVNIQRLRRKVEENPASPKYIHNVRGFGYTLNPVQPGGTAPAGTRAATG